MLVTQILFQTSCFLSQIHKYLTAIQSNLISEMLIYNTDYNKNKSCPCVCLLFFCFKRLQWWSEGQCNHGCYYDLLSQSLWKSWQECAEVLSVRYVFLAPSPSPISWLSFFVELLKVCMGTCVYGTQLASYHQGYTGKIQPKFSLFWKHMTSFLLDRI